MWPHHKLQDFYRTIISFVNFHWLYTMLYFWSNTIMIYFWSNTMIYFFEMCTNTLTNKPRFYRHFSIVSELLLNMDGQNEEYFCKIMTIAFWKNSFESLNVCEITKAQLNKLQFKQKENRVCRILVLTWICLGIISHCMALCPLGLSISSLANIASQSTWKNGNLDNYELINW